MTTATRTKRPTTVAEEAHAQVTREAVLAWVPIPEMKVSPMAQRQLNPHWVNELMTEMDLEQLGNPTVNRRGGHYYIIDGQHRIEALRALGLGDSTIQAWTYEGLSEKQEAEMFLRLNNKLTVNANAKFKVGVAAGREEETSINAIVTHFGFKVAQDTKDNSITAVNTLRRVYRLDDGKSLTRALWLIKEAYGDSGLKAPVILGLGMLAYRYDDQLDDAAVARRLSTARGGVSGLLNKAHTIREIHGAPIGHSVAAAAVEIHNGSRDKTTGASKRLPKWWRDTDSQKR